MMSVLSRLRSPRLTFLMTLLSLATGIVAVLSPFWVEGCMKKPKPFCSPVKKLRCIQVEDPNNGSSNAGFSWETGDDSFVFPTFHWGLWISCQENIRLDNGEEMCRNVMTLTPGSERGILWLSVGMETLYIGLVFLSCLLLLLQLCLSSCFPAAQRWGQLLNAYSALFTVLGGLLGMVAHMMFMQVFQVTISIGPEDFKPHSYGYSWSFYMAWLGFLFCMSSGISTLNNYTKKVLMRGPKHKTTPAVYPCRNFTYPPQPPQSSSQSAKSALYHSLPPPPAVPPPSPPSPSPSPPLSPLSPYYTTSSGDVLTVTLPVHQQRELELQMQLEMEREREMEMHMAREMEREMHREREMEREMYREREMERELHREREMEMAMERERHLLQRQGSLPPLHSSSSSQHGAPPPLCPCYANTELSSPSASPSLSPVMSGQSYAMQYTEEDYNPL